MRFTPHAFLVLILAVSLSLTACGGGGGKTRSDRIPTASDIFDGPRPNPGVLQQFERRSMLFNARDHARIVSGSHLVLRSTGSSSDPSELLLFADTWLYVNPLTLLVGGRRSTFDHLTDTTINTVMREIGAKGIYVAPTRGSGSLWAFNKNGTVTGEDVVTFDFSVAAGDENQYGRFINTAMDNQFVIGMDMVPSFTGLGPDFFLAACNVREYPGVYCMIEIPQAMWPSLPMVSSRWEGVALDLENLTALSSKGILPAAMLSELSPLSRKTGWAATNEIPGVDGTKRRWVYRYFEKTDQPVLNWEDPSQAAHRIFSGSAVLQTGLQGQSLVGLRFEAFQGLEAAPPNPEPSDYFSIEPALSAAQSMGREIRRCGGWSWLRDSNLTLPALADFLNAETDLVYDSVFSPATEHALLTGDASLLRYMADQLLASRLDTRRLVHAMPDENGLTYALPHVSYMASVMLSQEAEGLRTKTLFEARSLADLQSPSPFSGGVLYTTSAGVAALAFGLSPEEVPQNLVHEISRGHSLMIFFRAMQPGVLMLSGQDLVGALPLSWRRMVDSPDKWDVEKYTRGAYALSSLTASVVVTPLGMAKTTSLYGPADVQIHKPDSFMVSIGKFLRERAEVRISNGVLVARPDTEGKGTIALATALENDGGLVLTVCNFSREKVKENISLAGVPGFKSGPVRTLGGNGQYSVRGSSVFVELGPWEGRAILIGN